MADDRPLEDDILHKLKNHLAVVLGFCELLIAEMDESDPRRPDLVEMQSSVQAASALLPEIARRMR